MSNVRQPPVSPVKWQAFVAGYERATERLSLTSKDVNPVEEILQSARAVFGDDTHAARDFALRYWALLDLVRRQQVDEWVSRDNDGEPTQLHPALLLAAAEVRLTRTSKFPIKRFRSRVAEIIETERA